MENLMRRLQQLQQQRAGTGQNRSMSEDQNSVLMEAQKRAMDSMRNGEQEQSPDEAIDDSEMETPGYQAGDKAPIPRMIPPDLSEQDTEELVAAPGAPEEVRKQAIQRVRQKYLGN